MPSRFATSVSSRLSVTRTLMGAVVALGLLCVNSTAYAVGPTGLLNDTGQTLCYDGSNGMVACTVSNTGDAATYKRQDGRFGRDPAAPAKVGGGMAGFDFTRVCFNGDLQGAGTCTGTLVANGTAAATSSASTDWACTKDNVTNLIWSLQTQSASWENATHSTYPDAGHNTPSRCGFNTGWRLPTRRELMGIVLNDDSPPTIDYSYFPDTAASQYWTSDVYSVWSTTSAWYVSFTFGGGFPQPWYPTVYNKTYSFYVRLVRSGQ